MKKQETKEPCVFYIRGHCSDMKGGKCPFNHSMKTCVFPDCGKRCGYRHPGICFQLQNYGFCHWKNCSYRHTYPTVPPGNPQCVRPYQETPPPPAQHTVLLTTDYSTETEDFLSLKQKLVNQNEEMKVMKETLEAKVSDISAELAKSEQELIKIKSLVHENNRLNVILNDQEETSKLKLKAMDDTIMLIKEESIKLDEKHKSLGEIIDNAQVAMKKEFEFTEKGMEQVWYKFESIQEEMEEKFSLLDQVTKKEDFMKSLKMAEIKIDSNAKERLQTIHDRQRFDRGCIELLETKMAEAMNQLGHMERANDGQRFDRGCMELLETRMAKAMSQLGHMEQASMDANRVSVQRWLNQEQNC